MAKSIKFTVEFPELQAIKKQFDNLRPSLQRKYMGSAIRKTLKPGIEQLRSTTPKGPTGNLKRAIASKVKTYKNGAAVGLVGYIAAGSKTKAKSAAGGKVRKGKNLGYHMGLLEFGTKDRYTKGRIASSFIRLGPFQLQSNGLRVQTSPAYPRAFFKRAAAGQRVYLSSMPIGGSTGQPPVKTAFKRALPAMQALLPVEMSKAIQKAFKDMADKFPRKAAGKLPVTPF